MVPAPPSRGYSRLEFAVSVAPSCPQGGKNIPWDLPAGIWNLPAKPRLSPGIYRHRANS